MLLISFLIFILCLTVDYINVFIVDYLYLELNHCPCVLNSDVSALSTCPSLEFLHLEHNPVVEDPLYRSVVIQSLDVINIYSVVLQTFSVCSSS